MTQRNNGLRIIGVNLPDQSLRTHRELTNGHATLYDVEVNLSRSVDEYERRSLAEEANVVVGADDRMLGVMTNTTLEEIRDNIDAIQDNIANAITNAQAYRDEALAEDERLRQLDREVNELFLPTDDDLFGK